METLEQPAGDWFGHLALRALAGERQAIERRARRHRLHLDDRHALRKNDVARNEILALGRARVRADSLGDGVAWEKKRIHPLNMVRMQMNELAAAGLSLECLNLVDTGDGKRIRELWPEWNVGDDIDLSWPSVSQRVPERDGTVGSADVRRTIPAATTGPESPDPPV